MSNYCEIKEFRSSSGCRILLDFCKVPYLWNMVRDLIYLIKPLTCAVVAELVNAVTEDIGARYPEIYAELFVMARNDNEGSIRRLWNGTLTINTKYYPNCISEGVWAELQQQSEENFELCQILEAQLPSNDVLMDDSLDDSATFRSELLEDEMESKFEWNSCEVCFSSCFGSSSIY